MVLQLDGDIPHQIHGVFFIITMSNIKITLELDVSHYQS